MSRQFSQSALPRIAWVVVGAIALGSSSCADPATIGEAEAPDAEVSSEDALQVVTTFLPMTQFATAVAGDRAEVVQLLPTNIGPHDYQAKPDDVRAIANADVLVKNGLEVEFFLDDMIENAENADLAIVDSSEGVATLEEDEEHDHGHNHGESEGDDHGEEAHGGADPHIWLDPKRAIAQVENIRDGLIAADPAGEAEYRANADEFAAELTELDADIVEMLSPFEGQTFVILHDFAAYFADSYGLQFRALVEVPEENPSPEDVKQVMDTVQAEGLKTLLGEPQVERKSFEAIASDLGISIRVFDPMETGESTASQPDYYLDVMRQNAENLAAGFETSR